jgi:hypothetical protein
MSEYRDSIGRLAYTITKRGKDAGDIRLKGYKRMAAGSTASHSAQPSDVSPIKSHTFPTYKQQTTNGKE